MHRAERIASRLCDMWKGSTKGKLEVAAAIPRAAGAVVGWSDGTLWDQDDPSGGTLQGLPRERNLN